MAFKINDPSWFNSIGKRPSVEADLAIYGIVFMHVLGVFWTVHECIYHVATGFQFLCVDSWFSKIQSHIS